MTPHDFCCWLMGYLIGMPNAVDPHILQEFEKVDLTILPWYMPVAPENPPQAPSSPPAYSPRDSDWYDPQGYWYWDSTVNCWKKFPAAVAQHYYNQFRTPG